MKKIFPQQNHVAGSLFLFDDVINCGDVSLSAVYCCYSKVGNKIWEQYILSCFDNFKTIQMLNNKHFKLKHRAEVFCQTGSLLNRHANIIWYDSTCTKIWPTGSIIEEIAHTCDWSYSLQNCWIECLSCIVGDHVYDVYDVKNITMLLRCFIW